MCLLERACDFPKPAAHRSHALRSGPVGKRLQIARRNVTSAARLIPFSSTRAAWYSQRPASLLNFWRDRIKMR